MIQESRRDVDTNCAAGYGPCPEAAEDAGYELDEAEVIYWGRCPECRLQAKTKTDRTGGSA
jgi:hypothetical protein